MLPIDVTNQGLELPITIVTIAKAERQKSLHLK